MLREMGGRQERRKTGRRQETEEGGKDYQMRWWKSCGQHLTPKKGKKRKRERESSGIIILYSMHKTGKIISYIITYNAAAAQQPDITQAIQRTIYSNTWVRKGDQ